MCTYAIDIDDSVKKFFSAKKIIQFWRPEFIIQESINKQEKPDDLDDNDFYRDFVDRKNRFLDRIANSDGFNNRGRGRGRGRGQGRGRISGRY